MHESIAIGIGSILAASRADSLGQSGAFTRRWVEEAGGARSGGCRNNDNAGQCRIDARGPGELTRQVFPRFRGV